VSQPQAIARRLSPPFFITWLSMLVVLVATHALITVAQHPGRHSSWPFWPVTHATLLGAIVGALIAIAAYVGLSYRFPRLRQHGAHPARSPRRSSWRS
jgi:hypothetical protein